jgi:hypothetical protein
MKRSMKKILLDLCMTVVLLALMVPKLTGLSLHEWGGLAICLAFIVHLLLNWSWVACVSRKLFSKLPAKTRLNYMLDALILIGFFLIVLSGMAIAKTIDFSWLHLPGQQFFWRKLHTSASMMTFLAVAMHVGLHWNWILCCFRQKKEAESW